MLTTSKRPLTKSQYTITTRINEHGIYRGEVDFTGPMGKLGDVSFGYRLVAAVQDGDSFFKNVLDNRQVIHPSFQMVYKNTVVRLAFDYQHLEHIPNANNFLTPTESSIPVQGATRPIFSRARWKISIVAACASLRSRS